MLRGPLLTINHLMLLTITRLQCTSPPDLTDLLLTQRFKSSSFFLLKTSQADFLFVNLWLCLRHFFVTFFGKCLLCTFSFIFLFYCVLDPVLCLYLILASLHERKFALTMNNFSILSHFEFEFVTFFGKCLFIMHFFHYALF